MKCYVVMSRGKWLRGSSCSPIHRKSYMWTSDPFEAQVFETTPHDMPRGARAVPINLSQRVFDAMFGADDVDLLRADVTRLEAERAEAVRLAQWNETQAQRVMLDRNAERARAEAAEKRAVEAERARDEARELARVRGDQMVRLRGEVQRWRVVAESAARLCDDRAEKLAAHTHGVHPAINELRVIAMEIRSHATAPKGDAEDVAKADAETRSAWWCPHCEEEVPPIDVTYQETHGEQNGGCGHSVQSLTRTGHVGGKPTTKRERQHDADGWRTCEFCGCNTNAKLRFCCVAGHAADAARTTAKTKPEGT